ncbi:MAG: 50S ribosomal protein L11 methyltransferase [Candidatus Marinimicrobia bacterium]|nr:50S ribosomal protein L11 methyltransferase [Candidatus Neomarinimicrobiota bacterium]
MTDIISKWISVDISIAEKIKEIAMDYALAVGGAAVVEKDTTFQVSYPMDDKVHSIIHDLKAFLMDLDPDVLIQETVVYRENWNKQWQDFFKPTQISEQIIILPEWEKVEDFPHRIKTRIRPAMAFGTGTHETTQLCLQILEESIREKDHVLDVGTGSGILGITALHLGAANIDAIENDPLAEENIQDNLSLNGISKGFRLQISDQPILHPPYDLLVVNIIKARLFPILPNYFNVVRPEGRVIISGLLIEEESELKTLLMGSSWRIINTYTKNEWIAFLCEVD